MNDSVYRQGVGATRPDVLSDCTAKYTEEDWVDWVLGSVPEQKLTEMRSRYVERYEPAALPVMSSPESIALPLDGGRLAPDSGMVWYNESSREMLMLVGGIVPREDQIVEVWAVKEGTRDSLGLLQYHAYRAHLYVKNKEALQEADNLVLTVETRNGDPDDLAPKDTIFVDLTSRRKE
ncbi:MULTISPECIES: anti-sigma factor domain-containing protein [Paenibacillus]|uniref:anti-sigma factor domain-containing protein n=1 Tax=Paenibacillus TaxID=44249 RepID=UPI002FE17218